MRNGHCMTPFPFFIIIHIIVMQFIIYCTKSIKETNFILIQFNVLYF